MITYLAGGVSGNLSKNFKTMNLYLAENVLCKNLKRIKITDSFILESFYYCQKNKYIKKVIPLLRGFLLDSGAFTFMNQNKQVDWHRYIEQYADFINETDIDLFFELDIDSIVGLKKVEEYRSLLESLTGKKPIPVWHKSRGLQYFERMCEEYPYVALGGIVTNEIPRKVYEKNFPWFIKTAHQHGVKIHGLGYSSANNLKKYHFDSVDSSSWLAGNRGGFLYVFNEATGEMKQVPAPQGYRLNPQKSAEFNFYQWMKFQDYAVKFL